MTPRFETEYATNAEFLRRLVCRRVGDTPEVDDITQEAFLRLYVRLGVGVDERWHTRKWLCVVAGRLCIDELRRRRRRVLSECETELLDTDTGAVDAPFLRLEATEGDPEREYDLTQVRQRMRRAASRLNATDRRMLAMRELTGLSYEQMSQRLRKSGAAVETALFRARRNFQKHYRALEVSA